MDFVRFYINCPEHPKYEQNSLKINIIIFETVHNISLLKNIELSKLITIANI